MHLNAILIHLNAILIHLIVFLMHLIAFLKDWNAILRKRNEFLIDNGGFLRYRNAFLKHPTREFAQKCRFWGFVRFWFLPEFRAEIPLSVEKMDRNGAFYLCEIYAIFAK